MSVWNFILEWLKEHLLTCPSKHLFHMDCPGCGLQRSILALLEGDFTKSFALYPATIPIIVLLSYTALHIKLDFRYGSLIIKWGYIACTAIIMISYLYKIITHKIF
ncbi:MAG: DUF2752 domain-containing protein [Bacteroidales bacterium]|nr:DUF2752 domain-containing protein [Bacteroidales bacterium]